MGIVKNLSDSSKPKKCQKHNYIYRDNYSLHIKAAKRHGISLLENDKDITKFRKSGKLVKVQNGKGYKVRKLHYSRKVLSKRAAKFLSEIGRSFNKQTNGSYFTATSLTRTMYLQKKLAKTNSNATNNISTHCYGASFDISYIRFNGNKRYNIPSETVGEMSEKIIRLIEENPTISVKELAVIIEKSTRTIERKMAALKKEGRIKRIEPDKGGYWKVISE